MSKFIPSKQNQRILLWLSWLMPCVVFAQGALTPPGPPAPSMKTLQQIEPRIPISAAPAVITTPGSYYLTTNLVSSASIAISISADNVTLDLGGWEIAGAPGSMVGISSGTRTNLAIRNGTIRGISGTGLNLASAAYSTIEKITAIQNTGTGIQVGSNCRVVDCTALRNGTAGITAGSGTMIRNCAASGNATRGFSVGGNSQVESCISQSNTQRGFEATGAGTQWRSCVAAGNSEGFFSVWDNCRFQSCTASTNAADGFFLSGAGQMVMDSQAELNGGNGFAVEGSGSMLQNCIARGNNTGFFGINSVTFRQCLAQANQNNGFSGVERCRYERCDSLENGGMGFEMNGYCLLDGVQSSFNMSLGVMLYLEGNVVRDSLVSSNKSYGIRIGSSSVISGCHVFDNAKAGGATLAGILFTGTRAKIDNNTVMRNGPYGIFNGFVGSATNNVIIRNHVSGHTTANISVGGNHSVTASGANVATNLNPYVNFSLP